MAVIIIVALFAVIGIGSVLVTKKDQNPVEQMAEREIEKELGMKEGSVDLTPSFEKPKTDQK